MVMATLGMAALCRDAATGQVTPVNQTINQTVNGVNIVGDTLYVSFYKVNGSMFFLGTLASNNIAALNLVSNAVNGLFVVSNNFVTVSNNFRVVSNSWAAVAASLTTDGSGDLTAGGNLTVNDNLTVEGSLFGAYWLDWYNNAYGVSPGMVPTAIGTDGSWQWQALPSLPTTMNFDGGAIYSDGSGDIYAAAVQAELWDSGDSSGGGGQVPTANGNGTWTWQTPPTLPYTLNFDGGAIYSDGSGDLYATTVKAQLWDNGYSSGGSGQVPTANGDGTWAWQPPATANVVSGGGTMNFDGGNITSDGGGDVTIAGTASFMGGQTVIDYGSGGVQLKINGGSGYQSGGAQIDVAGTVCMTAGGEVDVGNGGSFTDPSPGAGYDVKCGGAAGGITSIGQINANGGFFINNQNFVDGSGNVTAASIQTPQLQDSITSSGTGGQVAMAQGDGTWVWQTPMPQVFTNAAGARFALVVNAQTNGFIFVPQ